MPGKVYFVLLLFLGILPAQGQNLVLNPGFELTDSCPDGISEFPLCIDWSNTTIPEYDSCTTPDLYAACASVASGVNVPNALLGYRQAHSGSHFAGFILGDGLSGCELTGDNYREYVEGELSGPLVAGQQYQVSFYLSLAAQSMWGTNSIGVYFSDTFYLHNACTSALIRQTPQLSLCGPAIMDTLNWVRVSWLYTATGNEGYFIIGNFNNDSLTNRVTNNCATFNPYIYYYIDDVSITPANNAACPFSIIMDSVNAGCAVNNGSLQAAIQGCDTPFTYRWSTGDTGTSLSNLAPGVYLLTVTDGALCSETTSVVVGAGYLNITDSATQPSDCNTTDGAISVTVTGDTGITTYRWSNGDTTAEINGLPAGYYTVTVSSGSACSGTAGFTLSGPNGPIPVLSVMTTPDICNSGDGSATAIATSSFGLSASYLWSNGSTSSYISGLSAGSYQLTVTENLTSCSAFANVIISAESIIIIASDSNPLCGANDGAISLYLSGAGGPYNYLWSNNDTTSSLGNLDSGTYSVTVTNGQCSDSVAITLGRLQYFALVLWFNPGKLQQYVRQRYSKYYQRAGAFQLSMEQ